MSRVKISISKLSDEIQFFNDIIHTEILNNPENVKFLRNLYIKRLEELYKEQQDKV